MKNDARILAYLILNQFEKTNSKLNQIINEVYVKYNPSNNIKSRSVVISNEVVRLRSRLDLMIEHVSGKSINYIDRPLKTILRIGFYEVVIDDEIPDYAAINSIVNIAKRNLNRKATGFTNAILRKLTRLKNQDNNWLKLLEKNDAWNSLPIWMQKRWKNLFTKIEFNQLVECVNTPPSNFIRIDPDQCTLEEVKYILEDIGIKSTIFSKLFLKSGSGFGKIFQTDLFKNGIISIQNPASAAIVDCINAKKGESILDVCAAPGTKSLYLSSIVGKDGIILASDILSERVENGKIDVKRHGKNNIKWDVKDATKDSFPMTNRILIDAPCTGTGIIRRKSDIRWRRSLDDVYEMSKIQLRILTHCSKFLNPSGTLVYATCSLEIEENWMVVEQFLKLNNDFSLDYIPSEVPREWVDDKKILRTYPHIHGVDGMFAVKMKRKT